MSDQETVERPGWDEIRMEMVETLARRSVCIYHQVACIFHDINKGNAAEGYNGPVTGEVHCRDDGVGCAKDNGGACRGLHAEDNAINHCLTSPREALKGSTLYITVFPCTQCMKKLQGLQIARIVFLERYVRHQRDGELEQDSDQEFTDAVQLAKAASPRIRVEQYDPNTKKATRIA